MSDTRPISQIYAEVGEQWALAKARADILEDTRSAFLSQKIMEHQSRNSDLAYNKAEAFVKASLEWTDRIHETIEARKEANLLWVKMESIKMAHSEWQSQEANERMQARL